jgi:hypothetical protein
MNGAPVQGFEIDVGRKTTVRVTAFNAVQTVISTSEQHMDSLPKYLVAWGGIQLSNHDTSSYKRLLTAAKKYPHMKVYRSLEEHDLYQDRVFQEETGLSRSDSGAWLSTGWFSIALMVKFCQSISIYGMVPPDHCRVRSASRVLYHYWDPNSEDECFIYRSNEGKSEPGHRFITEKMIFARWALKYNFTFYSPYWNPKDYVTSNVTNKP